MRTRFRTLDYLVFSLVFVGAFVLSNGYVTAPPADAHSASTFFDYSFTSDPNLVLGNMDGDLDLGASRQAETLQSTNNAIAQWNGISGSTFDITGAQWDKSVVWLGTTCATAPTIDSIAVVGDNIGALGTASWCRITSQSRITRSVIRIDYRNWNAGGAINPGEFDFQSVLTHELGHSAGMGRGSLPGHFTGSGPCPSESGGLRTSDNTMCSGTLKGETHKRTLQSHDKHTIAAHY